MVSLVILGLVSSGFAYGLQLTLAVTRADRARVQAANLAARELEVVRNDFGASKTAPTEIGAVSQVTNPNPLPGQTAGQPLQLDGMEFTVVRTVEWLPAGTGTSPCDGGNAVTYPSLAVNVTVSWNENGQTRDVESNTVLTPPKGTLATVKAFIAAKVQGADGTGVASLPVDLSGPGGSQTRVTAADGCAVFALTTVGNYTVTLDQPGYVSFDGQESTSKPAAVSAGTIQIVPFSYDEALTLQLVPAVTDGAGPGFTLPTPAASIVLFNPGLPTMGKLVIPSGQTEVTGLWPFPDGYSVWPGRCSLNDPASSGGSRPAPVIADPGDIVDAEVGFKPVRFTFVDDEGSPLQGEQVRATIDNTDECSGETQYVLGETDDQGVVESALPYGQWTVTAGELVHLADVTGDGSVAYPLVIPQGGG
jgi:type II secretory pathway pseudopilin PulG